VSLCGPFKISSQLKQLVYTMRTQFQVRFNTPLLFVRILYISQHKVVCLDENLNNPHLTLIRRFEEITGRWQCQTIYLIGVVTCKQYSLLIMIFQLSKKLNNFPPSTKFVLTEHKRSQRSRQHCFLLALLNRSNSLENFVVCTFIVQVQTTEPNYYFKKV